MSMPKISYDNCQRLVNALRMLKPRKIAKKNDSQLIIFLKQWRGFLCRFKHGVIFSEICFLFRKVVYNSKIDWNHKINLKYSKIRWDIDEKDWVNLPINFEEQR